MVEAIKQNFPQREIADAAFRYQEEVERGERVVVGVNRYELDDETPLEILKIDAALEGSRSSACTALKGRRDSAKVEQRLAALKQASARDDVNLMPTDPRRRSRLRDDGRDVRRLARGLGHVARDARVFEALNLSLHLTEQGRGRRR